VGKKSKRKKGKRKMRYRFVFCDNFETALFYEAELEEYANKHGYDINVKRTKIGTMEKVSFEHASLQNGALKVEQNFPTVFSPSGDEALLEITIKKR
jgi:hypothetical protein